MIFNMKNIYFRLCWQPEQDVDETSTETTLYVNCAEYIVVTTEIKGCNHDTLACVKVTLNNTLEIAIFNIWVLFSLELTLSG